MQSDDQQPRQPQSPVRENQPVVTLSPQPQQTAGPEPSTDAQAESKQPTPTKESIHWQASEYVHREKDHIWFVLFIIATLALMAAAIFIIKSTSFTILIPVMAAALFIYTRRPPRMLNYTLDRHGLYINDQLFPFGEFKSFTLVHGLDHYSIMMIPTKRFKPAVAVNFPEEAGEAIVDTLAARLPMRQATPDVVDQIIRKLHL